VPNWVAVIALSRHGRWSRSSRTALPIERHNAVYTGAVSSRDITDELVDQVVVDLQERYALDEDDVRALGARLAEPDRAERRAQNVAFAEQFTADHRATFDRLSQ
jgi:hypothetical protein